MRDYYYGLSRNEGWAVMGKSVDDPNPPLVIFESREVAERYRHDIAGDDWEVMEMFYDEVEHHAEDSGNRIILCTKVGAGSIQKMEIDVANLFGREAELI